MRDISFRAKNLDGIWFKWKLLDPIDMATLAIDPQTLGQSTGLKDKNGVLIYEGDILGYPNPKIKREVKFGSEILTVEEYGQRMVGFYLTESNGERGFLEPNPAPYYEVIGDIYENPELIK